MAVINEIKKNLADVSSFHKQHIVSRIQQREQSSEPRQPADLLDFYLDHLEAEKQLKGKNEKHDIFPDVDPGNYHRII